MAKFLSILKKLFIGLLILPILFWIGIYLFQEQLIFKPTPLHDTYQYEFDVSQSFQEIKIPFKKNENLHGLLFKSKKRKGIVISFHGNQGKLNNLGKSPRLYTDLGYDIFYLNYRGFGKSKGKRTESILYNDGQHVYKWLQTQYDEDKIIIYGRSLGSGIATRIASWNHPKMLILDSPYYSFLRQIQRYGFLLPIRTLLKYQIRTDHFIKKVTCPIFFIHGKRDFLIPFKHSEMLHELVPKRSKIFPIEKAHHNDLPSFPEYHDMLYDILNDDEFLEEYVKRISESAQ